MNPPLLFSLNSGEKFAQKVSEYSGIDIAKHEERDFEDGEYKIRPLESVRGKEVIIVQSIYSDSKSSVNDKLVRLLFFIGALKESASKITIIAPYLCFSRKDRKTKARDPVTTRYMAILLEAIGTNHIVTMDVHNLQAFQNSFRCITDHLEGTDLFCSYIMENFKSDNIAIMSPDAGGMKRADKLRTLLENKINKSVSLIFMEKKRSEGVVSGDAIVGDPRGKNIVIIDDLISSGGTLSRAANACMESGANKVIAMVTHGVFSSKSLENLSNPNLEKIIFTNSLSRMSDELKEIHHKLEILDIAPLIGKFIQDKLIL